MLQALRACGRARAGVSPSSRTRHVGDTAFEVEFTAAATVLRHTVEGCASGKYQAIWRKRIEPLHNLILEALFDNVQAVVVRPDSYLGPDSVR